MGSSASSTGQRSLFGPAATGSRRAVEPHAAVLHGRWRTLADCALRIRDHARPTSLPQLPFVGLEHVGAGTLRLDGHGNSTQVTSHCLRFQQGDFLFGALRPRFRKLVRAPFSGLCSAEFWVLRPRPGIHPDFLFYWLASPAFIQHCAAGSQGTRMPRARWSHASRHRRLIPGLLQQEQQTHIPRALDDKARLLREMSASLQELNELLWRQGSTHRDAEPVRLGHIARCIRQRVAPSTLAPETPYVGLEHVPRRAAMLQAHGQARQVGSKKFVFQAGDFLFGALRPLLHKVLIAPFDGICSTDILVIRPQHPRWWSPLFATLFSDTLVAHATACASGTRMPRVRWPDLSRYPISLPPLPTPPPPSTRRPTPARPVYHHGY